MSTIDDLAALIAHRRTELEKIFDSEIARLRLVHADRIVDEALTISRTGRRREDIAVSSTNRLSSPP